MATDLIAQDMAVLAARPQRRTASIDIAAELAAIGWDAARFPIGPIGIETLEGAPRCTDGADVEALWKATCGDPAGWPAFYVRADGSNANTGASDVQAFATIEKAVQAANAGAVPARVLVKGGYYNRTQTFGGAGGTTQPSVAIAFYAYGGRATVAAAESGAALAWTADGTNAWVSSGTRTGVLRVVDLRARDRFGHYGELVPVADLATCARTPNSWCQSGSSVKVNRADGALASEANTRVFMTVPNFQQAFAAQRSFWFGGVADGDGFDFEGGSQGCLFLSFNAAAQVPAAKGMVAARGCTFRYAGGFGGAERNAVAIQSFHGLVAFQSCDASKASADGFNAHDSFGDGRIDGQPSIGAQTALLTVNCTGFDNGRGQSVSNNGWTLHEAVAGVSICDRYSDARGSTLHVIDNSRAFALGTRCAGSLGDIVNGGATEPCEFRAANAARLTLRLCEAAPGHPAANALRADDTSVIATRDCVLRGSRRTFGTATIRGY